MSQFTQCPACGTLFKVIADQLKISQGWVRCGQCREVFDANSQLASAARALAQGATSATQTTDTSTVIQPIAEQEFDATEKVAAPPELPQASTAARNTRALITTRTKPQGDDQSLSARRDDLPSNFAADSKKDYEDSVSALASDMREDASGFDTPQTSAEQPDEPLPTPSFVRKAQRAARWRSPWMRAGLVLVSMVLLVSLAAQIALQERAKLIAMLPQTQGGFQWLCAQLGCAIEPLKQIESIVVDASAFNKLKSGGTQEAYRLKVTLKNTAQLAVAVPHLELSLNDSQDVSLLRRVLTPEDLGATGRVLAARGDFAGGVSVQVDGAQLGGARIAGYRVLAFYP